MIQSTLNDSVRNGQISRRQDLRLLTINISGPSVERAERLAAFMLPLDVDVAVLTETRANLGTERLLAEFEAAGYGIQAVLPSSKRERGVAVLNRTGSSSGIASPAQIDLSHRLAIEEIREPGDFRLIAVYVPSRDATSEKIDRKRRFLDQMVDVVQQEAMSGRVVLMGDLNVVGRTHLPRYPAFRAWEYDALDHVVGHGLVDAFTELHPGVQAHSWIGRTGNGYRYDYAFVSGALTRALRGCEYLHEPRLQGLSDHAALLLTLCGESLATQAASDIRLAAA